jgi:hypothetical protein
VLPFVVAGLVVLNLERGILQPSTRRRRRDGAVRAHGLVPGTGVGDALGGTSEDENDVTEPANRHLHVDKLREPR